MRLIADGVVERDGVEGLAPAPRLQQPPPDPAADPRARRRPAGAGPGPARAERADPHRDHRLAARRRRLRGRLRQRPAVQRHDPRGLLPRTPTRAARLHHGRPGQPAAARPHGPDASTCGCRSGRRSTREALRDLPGPAPRAGCRGRRAGLVRPEPALPHGPATSGSTWPAHEVRRTAPAVRVPRCTSSDLRDLAPAVERCRRLLDADCDPVAVDAALADDPLLAPLVRAASRACASPGTSTATSSRSGPCSASRSRSPRRTGSSGVVAEPGGRAAARRAGRTTASTGSSRQRRGRRRSTPTPCRCRARGRRALVGLAAALADGDVSLDRSADRGRDPRRAARPARHRAVDRRLRRDARARRPRRLPADRRGGAPRRSTASASAAPSVACRAPRPGGPGAPTHSCTSGRRSSTTARTRDRTTRKDTDMWTIMDSPVGELRLVAQDGALTAIEFLGEMPTGPDESASVAAPRRRAADGSSRAGTGSTTTRCSSRRRASSTAYFAGDLKDFDLPVRAERHAVPAAGVGGAAGRSATARPRTYGEIAARLGLTGHGARAVGHGQRPQPGPDRHPVPPGGRAPTAASPATAAACTASRPCSSSSRTPSSNAEPPDAEPRLDTREPPFGTGRAARGRAPRLSAVRRGCRGRLTAVAGRLGGEPGRGVSRRRGAATRRAARRRRARRGRASGRAGG